MTATLEAPTVRETPGTNATFALLELKQVTVSETNPRRGITDESVAELAASVREHGIVEPLLVRKTKRADRFEIVAGHRRFHAAKVAGLENVPCIVTTLDDQAALEIQILENLQRADLTPLEEAEGYRQLITKYAYTAERIAEKIGMSLKYVYDRVKLLELIPEARELVAARRLTAGHAILLARLAPADQKRAIDPEANAAFSEEHTLWDPLKPDLPSKDRYEGLKARTVRELEAWIDKHVRFDASKPDAVDPMLFPHTYLDVKNAAEQSRKVIMITHDHYVQPEARCEKGRTWGPRSWKRADGLHKSKKCEHSITGVIVVGPGRGESFDVCVAREKCATHWGGEMRKAATRARKTAAAGKPAKPKRDSWEIQQEREKAQREAFKPMIAPLSAAIIKAILAAPTNYGSEIATIALRDVTMKKALVHLPKPKTAEDVLRLIAIDQVADTNEYWAPKHLPEVAKRFGVDVKKVAEAAGVQVSAKPRKRGTKKKGGAK